ncbi:hypothetical protein IFR05_015648, partial [Cadophora sp. M221]
MVQTTNGRRDLAGLKDQFLQSRTGYGQVSDVNRKGTYHLTFRQLTDFTPQGPSLLQQSQSQRIPSLWCFRRSNQQDRSYLLCGGRDGSKLNGVVRDGTNGCSQSSELRANKPGQLHADQLRNTYEPKPSDERASSSFTNPEVQSTKDEALRSELKLLPLLE